MQATKIQCFNTKTLFGKHLKTVTEQAPICGAYMSSRIRIFIFQKNASQYASNML
jgi:hypothetical protein